MKTRQLKGANLVKFALVATSILGTLLGWAQISSSAAPDAQASLGAAPTTAAQAPVKTAPNQLRAGRRNAQTMPAPLARTRSSR